MKPGSFVVFIKYPNINKTSAVQSYNFIPFSPILEETVLTIRDTQKIGNILHVSFVEIDIIDQDGDTCSVSSQILKEVELPKLPNFIEEIEFENV